MTETKDTHLGLVTVLILAVLAITLVTALVHALGLFWFMLMTGFLIAVLAAFLGLVDLLC